MGEKAYGLARVWVEFFLYFIFFLLLLRNMVHGKLLTRTVIDLPVFLFFAISLLSVIINHVPIGMAILGWRDLMRWLFLFYIMANINVDEKFHKKIILSFVVISCIQGGLAIVQHFAGISSFFLPRATTLEVGGKITNFKLLAEGNKGFEKGSGVGTIADTVQLANYLLISLAVVVPLFLQYTRTGALKRFANYFVWVIIMGGIFMTYSRVTILFALLAIFISYLVAKELRKLFPIALLGSLIIIVSLAIVAIVPSNKSSTYFNPRVKETSPADNFTQLFSSGLMEKSIEASRGYVIQNALPALIKSLNLIGYGPDTDGSLLKLVQRDLDNATPFANYRIINDVYWVGMLTCYGFIGVSIFLFILYRLYRMARFVFYNTDNMHLKILALAFLTIVIIVIPYTFVIRTFIFRMFSFYFWLLAGIMASEYRRLKEEEMIQAELAELSEIEQLKLVKN